MIFSKQHFDISSKKKQFAENNNNGEVHLSFILYSTGSPGPGVLRANTLTRASTFFATQSRFYFGYGGNGQHVSKAKCILSLSKEVYYFFFQELADILSLINGRCSRIQVLTLFTCWHGSVEVHTRPPDPPRGLRLLPGWREGEEMSSKWRITIWT